MHFLNEFDKSHFSALNTGKTGVRHRNDTFSYLNRQRNQ